MQDNIQAILRKLGLDVDGARLKQTPERFAQVLQELTSKDHTDPKTILTATHDVAHEDMVVAKAIPFYSLCEHELLPFFGVAHIAYIPNKDRVVGVSKIAALVSCLSKDLQLQERLTNQLANEIDKHLMPKGVAVVLKARHLCQEMRGGPRSEIITSAVRGLFQTNPATRDEFFQIIGGGL